MASFETIGHLVLFARSAIAQTMQQVKISSNSEYLLSIVNIKEIRVERSLNNTSDKRCQGEPVIKPVSVNPIDDIESSVKTKRKDVVNSKGFTLTGSLKHKKLGQDGNGFKPQRKGPSNVDDGVFSFWWKEQSH